MKKLICRPYLSLVFILFALFFPVEAWAELYFMYSSGGPQVTEKSVNWSERGSQVLSWPIAVYDGKAVTVTYSSGDVNKATVDNNGIVTIVSPGVVPINASYTRADDGQTFNASYTLTIVDDRDDMATAGAAFSSSTASATYGDATVNTPTISTGKLGNATFTYSSSDESVATVNNSGNVTIKGAGTAEIKASFVGNETFKPGYLTYTLTVAQKEVGLTWGTVEFTYDGSAHVPTATATGLVGNDACTVTVDGAQINAGSYTATASALSNANYKLPAANTKDFTIAKAAATVAFASATVNAKMGENFTAPTATTTPSGLALTYASSNTSVATVDASTGAVTLKSAGSTTITASFAGNNNYNAAEASYTLTVAKADAVSAELSFSSQTAIATYGDASVTTPTLSNPHQVALTWTSSDTKVATVNNSGVVTIVGAGQTVISAAFAGNDTYTAATISYTLTVNKATATVTFASKTANAKMGENYTGQTATTSPANLPLVYSSSTPNVATVNESTGAVTLVKDGTTTITASFAGNDNYNSASDSYTLTVAKADAVSAELSFSSQTATATYGDASVTTPTLNNPHQVALTWTSSDTKVATINSSGVVTVVGAGQTVISAAFAGNDTYTAATISYTLTVNKATVTVAFDTESETATLGEPFTSPKATTTPRDLQLVYSSSDKHIAKVEGSTGEITLRGVGTVKITATYKGSDNYESASAFYELTVLEGQYEPTLEPIVKEEDYSMDEVYFVNADGTEVDLSNTIVNDILFTLKNQSSPEGDGYDTEEKCIVINTPTLTSTLDALLANGVEPGSAEYASQFTGLTFLVPAGDGFVIVTSQEAEGAYLMAKVGDREPVAIHMEEMGDYDIPYQSDEITFVYLWKGGSDAESGASTRGKKTASDVKIRGVAHKSRGSSGIQQVAYDTTGDQPWYDLRGQRISQPVKKGVYIHGNRKIVIK